MRATRRRVLLTVALVAIAATTLEAAEPIVKPGHPLSAGGSNYVSYHLANGCDREPYGVIDSFDKGRDTITGQLADMRAAGQHRLRVPIFHQHGPDSGTVMDSTGGDLSEGDRQQLTEFLAAVKAAGFDEIEVGFFPLGRTGPYDWTSWHEDAFHENWRLIANLRPLIADAGIPYKIDLLNEGMPTPDQDVLREYTTRLWAAYTGRFGKADTVGFSMTVPIADRATQLAAVYGDNPPDVFDVHLYGDGWNGDEYRQFVDADGKMTSLGYHQDWIIGETFFDDTSAAVGIDRAIGRTGRKVRYVAQWPLTRDGRCADVDVAPPIRFDAFGPRGESAAAG